MKTRRLALLIAPVAAIGLIATGCGSSSSSSSGSASQATGSATSPSVLAAEANSAAAGDIPDNQVFLTFADAPAGYSMQYPEGWAQKGTGKDVTFRDKNNVVHVVVAAGALPAVSAVTSQLDALKAQSPSLTFATPTSVTVSGSPAVKATYSTHSQPNEVTGKTVTLEVDRYYLSSAGKLAVVDLATPQGVDNVDAYRQMIESFRWK